MTALGRWAGLGLLVVGALVVVLIGQRMPVLLTGLGLFVTGLLLPRLRTGVLAACAGAALLLAVSAVVVPPTFHRLIDKFASQMEHFPDSPYGLITVRAAAMISATSWSASASTGSATIAPTRSISPAGAAAMAAAPTCACSTRTTIYLQAAVEGGVPGLALFSLLVLAWLRRLATGLWRDATPSRTGLFVAALLQVWPIASTSDFLSMPLSGWFFLLLGLGLAETRAYIAARTERGI